MNLDRIQIKGFKSIRELDLELRPLNVLIGANGSGKSNFMEVFRLPSQIVEKRLQNYVAKSGGANRLLHFGAKTTPEMQLKYEFARSAYVVHLAATNENNLFFSDEAGFWKTAEVNLGSGHIETKLFTQKEHEIIDFVIDSIGGWRVYHFHDTSDTAYVKLTGYINDNEFLRPDGSNLASYLYLLQKTQRPYYDQIVKTIRLAAPFFDDFVLRPIPENPDSIILEWQDKGSDVPFPASLLSDGTLRFICLTTLLMQPNLPSTILIDEPELGLHPYAINLLVDMLEIAATKTQVIVTTQSTHLVDQFAPENVIVVDREDNQSVFRRLNESEIAHWLEDYSLGELWEKNIIGGTP